MKETTGAGHVVAMRAPDTGHKVSLASEAAGPYEEDTLWYANGGIPFASRDFACTVPTMIQTRTSRTRPPVITYLTISMVYVTSKFIARMLLPNNEQQPTEEVHHGSPCSPEFCRLVSSMNMPAL